MIVNQKDADATKKKKNQSSDFISVCPVSHRVIVINLPFITKKKIIINKEGRKPNKNRTCIAGLVVSIATCLYLYLYNNLRRPPHRRRTVLFSFPFKAMAVFSLLSLALYVYSCCSFRDCTSTDADVFFFY